MKKIKYSEMKLKILFPNKVLLENFLQSVRQKMYGKRKF